MKSESENPKEANPVSSSEHDPFKQHLLRFIAYSNETEKEEAMKQRDAQRIAIQKVIKLLESWRFE